MINSLQPVDGDGNVIGDYLITKKTITFIGGTTNAIGDFNGTGDPFTIFNVAGLVRARVFGFCTTLLAGAAGTLEVGTLKGTADLIALSTGTDIDANEIWHDTAPDASVEAITVAPEYIVGQDIIGTVGTANLTSGVIDFYCMWKPLSPDANVS